MAIVFITGSTDGLGRAAAQSLHATYIRWLICAYCKIRRTPVIYPSRRIQTLSINLYIGANHHTKQCF